MGNVADSTDVSMINGIMYSIAELVEQGAVHVEMGSYFEFNSAIYVVDSVNSNTVVCSLDECDGAPSIELAVLLCKQLVDELASELTITCCSIS